MIDPQRELVYVMEAREFRGVWNNVKQPMRYLRSLAKQLCKFYDVPQVALCCKRLRIGAEYDADESLITFDTRGNNRNVFTLAHEIAHHICWQRYGWRVQDHGPKFVLIYGQVLSSLRIVPLAGWRAACKRHGVRIARWKSVR